MTAVTHSIKPTKSAATIVIRTGEKHPVVQGPSTFCGGSKIRGGGEPDGIFGEWRWDGNQLEARIDRLGMFPLYYSEFGGGIAVSTSIAALIEAGAPREIDWAALQLLLHMGFHIGCDTVFQAVKAFPVGGHLTWRPGKLEVKAVFPPLRANELSRAAAIDAYIELFRAAVRKRIVPGAPIRLPLSGGRDSRHILLELVAAGSPPECCYTSAFTTMPNDLRVARELCEALGVRHKQAAVPEDVVRAEMEKNRVIGYQALEHGWVWALAQSMAHPGAASYDGIAGDVLSAGHFHDDENSRLYRAGRFDDLARRLAPQPQIPLIPAGLRDAMAAADPLPSLIAELLRHRDTHNPMMFFYLFNRSRRAVSPTIQGIYAPLMRSVFAPFLDRDVFDFLAGLPESMFVDRMFHTEAIARAFPKTAAIAYAKKTPIPASVYRSYARQGIRFAMRAPASPLLSRPAAILRLARALFKPRYAAEAMWVLPSSVMLHQLGRLRKS